MEANSATDLSMRGVIYNQSINMRKTVNNNDNNIIIIIQEAFTFAFVTFGMSMTGMKLDLKRSSVTCLII
jgi:hypothetical protein